MQKGSVMADTMPKQGRSGQHEVSEKADAPLPAWVGLVKAAVVVMSVMIVIGLALLIYGLATGLNRSVAENNTPVTLQYPAGSALISTSAGAEGSTLLHFRMADGSEQIIIMAADKKSILGRISLEEAADFGITFR